MNLNLGAEQACGLDSYTADDGAGRKVGAAFAH